MRLGRGVVLFRDGVPYEYRLTLKGWAYATWFRVVGWFVKKTE